MASSTSTDPTYRSLRSCWSAQLPAGPYDLGPTAADEVCMCATQLILANQKLMFLHDAMLSERLHGALTCTLGTPMWHLPWHQLLHWGNCSACTVDPNIQ
jgi:hypothetical protein